MRFESGVGPMTGARRPTPAHPNPPSPSLTHPSALPTTFPPPSTLASLTYTYVHHFCRAIFRRHHDQQCFWVLSCKVGVVVWVRGGFAWQWQDSPPPATARPPPPPPPWYLNLPTTAEGQLKEKCIHQLRIWRLNLLIVIISMISMISLTLKQCVTIPKIWTKPNPNLFSDTKYFRYRFRYFFRYQILSDTESDTFFYTKFFPIPNPILFSIPNFSNTESDTFFDTKFFR